MAAALIKLLTPFLKWAGGKRWLAPSVIPLLDAADGTYFEPFLGGGAVFFAHGPTRAKLSDTNDDLIQVYRVIRDDVEEVIYRLNDMVICPEEFDRVRRLKTSDPIQHAVNFIYLNRTAFNGLYRVNRKGQFNVPFGCKPGTRLCDVVLLHECSTSLQGAQLTAEDFRESLLTAGIGDAVFVDPPYTVQHSSNGFRRYNERLFSWNDQIELASICNHIVQKGAKVVITNSYHHDVLDLYDADLFKSDRQ